MLSLRVPGLLLLFITLVTVYHQRAILLVHVNQLSIDVERRVTTWDWKDTPEEKLCRAGQDFQDRGPKDAIPNVAHFVMLAHEGSQVDLTYPQYLAVKAAVVNMNATQVKIHTNNFNTHNHLWQELRSKVTIVTLGTKDFIDYRGKSITSYRLSHQADFLRISILIREGGVYFDTDVYPLKPFTDLLHSPRDTLMGHEGGNRYGLCDAVIVSRPASKFMLKWQKTYDSFNPKRWNDHSVLMPKKLQVKNPDLVCPLSPSVFFWPTWGKDHIRYLHKPIDASDLASLRRNMTAFEGAMYENQLAIHSWSHGAHEYLPFLTPESIRENDTRFNVLFRKVASAKI